MTTASTAICGFGSSSIRWFRRVVGCLGLSATVGLSRVVLFCVHQVIVSSVGVGQPKQFALVVAALDLDWLRSISRMDFKVQPVSLRQCLDFYLTSCSTLLSERRHVFFERLWHYFLEDFLLFLHVICTLFADAFVFFLRMVNILSHGSEQTRIFWYCYANKTPFSKLFVKQTLFV